MSALDPQFAEANSLEWERRQAAQRPHPGEPGYRAIEFAYETCYDCGTTDYHHVPGCEYEHEPTLPVCWDCRRNRPAVWFASDNHSVCEPCANIRYANAHKGDTP